MLYVPHSGGFQTVLYGPAAARPAAAYGTSVTPGQNTKGTYAQLIAGASLTADVYGVLINVNSNFVTTGLRTTLLDIGYDPAGGSTYSVLIPDLLVGDASALIIGARPNGGISYYFPLFIKSGTSIAARAAVDNATVGTLRCWATFFCQPKRLDAVKVGSFVEALGAVAATSQGTTVTGGTTAEGAWTNLGTTAQRTWYHQAGFSCSNAARTESGWFMDLSAGAAGGEQLLEDDTLVNLNANNESVVKQAGFSLEQEVVAGATMWGRLQCSTTLSTGTTMMAYCLG